MAKRFIEYVYLKCVLSSSIPNEIKQNNPTVVKTLRENKKKSPKMCLIRIL